MAKAQADEIGHATIWIPGIPVPWARPRANGHRFFTATKVRAWMDRVRVAAEASMPTAPFVGPVRVEMRFSLPMPESWSEKKRNAMLTECHTVKPDVDNLAKGVLDAIDSAGWFAVGDQQVWSLKVEKVYAVECGVWVSVIGVE